MFGENTMFDTIRTTRSVAIAFAVALTIDSGSAQQPPARQVPVPMPEILQKYSPVTAERLLKPGDGDWLMVRRTYDGWGYSPLAQITPDNVTKLKPAWIAST